MRYSFKTMSQFQQRTLKEELEYEDLTVEQRQLMKNLTPPASSDMKSPDVVTPTKLNNSDDLSEDEEEWISNWQFERISVDKKTDTLHSVTSVNQDKSKLSVSSVDEGGVFYFQRIQQTTAVPAITSNPSVISASDSNIAVISQGSSSLSDFADDNQKLDCDQHDFFLDMTIDNDDLFADLEAAADSNDDSEISLDDLMDIDIEDDEQVGDHDDNFMRSLNTSQSSAAHDVNDFLNKSTSAASTALMNDDDIQMMSDDDGNAYNFSSPIATKETISSLHFASMPNSRSPTSVAHQSTLPLLPSACSMSSATTRPALQQMRMMMNELMDNGAMSRTRQNSRLPCAEGMDEMYLDTLRKLSASMERSKKTRKSLSIPMQTMQSSAHYSRSMCVNQIVQSVQASSQHVDTCLRSVSMMSR